MTDRLEHARRLGERIDAGWRREDIEAQLTRLHARRRRARRRVIVVPVMVAAMVIGLMMWPRAQVPVVREVAAVAPPVLAPVVAPIPTVVPPPPPVHDAVTAPPRGKDHPPPRAIRVDHDEPVVVPAPSWRDDAGRGDYEAAWAKLGSAQLDRMADLLLAGDVARLSNHAGAAIDPLARAVALHPDDPRAPLAAFTLGRVHLEDLGAPRDAAEAFARTRALAPDGPLAEDALAREVEAWSRAGEVETARARARLYLERYPHGRRIHAVRRFGAL